MLSIQISSISSNVKINALIYGCAMILFDFHYSRGIEFLCRTLLLSALSLPTRYGAGPGEVIAGHERPVFCFQIPISMVVKIFELLLAPNLVPVFFALSIWTGRRLSCKSGIVTNWPQRKDSNSCQKSPAF